MAREANSTVELGLIGCGGRGNWISPFFPEYTGAKIIAVADVIKDHLDSTQTKFKVDPSRAYYGPQAAMELTAVEAGRCDHRDAADLSSGTGSGGRQGGQACLLREADRSGRARMPEL